jgi:hypothetical protein
MRYALRRRSSRPRLVWLSKCISKIRNEPGLPQCRNQCQGSKSYVDEIVSVVQVASEEASPV